MSKRVAKVVKLEILGGQAKPGSALASAGINMPKFCSAFNDQTRDRMGEVVPVIITAYEDKSFDFVIKTTPVTNLIKDACNIKSGSSNPKTTKVATLSYEDAKKIAEYKMPDLNANDLDAAIKIVAGSARSMGVNVEEKK